MSSSARIGTSGPTVSTNAGEQIPFGIGQPSGASRSPTTSSRAVRAARRRADRPRSMLATVRSTRLSNTSGASGRWCGRRRTASGSARSRASPRRRCSRRSGVLVPRRPRESRGRAADAARGSCRSVVATGVNVLVSWLIPPTATRFIKTSRLDYLATRNRGLKLSNAVLADTSSHEPQRLQFLEHAHGVPHR